MKPLVVKQPGRETTVCANDKTETQDAPIIVPSGDEAAEAYKLPMAVRSSTVDAPATVMRMVDKLALDSSTKLDGHPAAIDAGRGDTPSSDGRMYHVHLLRLLCNQSHPTFTFHISNFICFSFRFPKVIPSPWPSYGAIICFVSSFLYSASEMQG